MGNKNINEIRKSIARRKENKREKVSTSLKTRKSTFQGLEEEEKHGYFPFASGDRSSDDGNNKGVQAFLFKALLSGIIFFATALLIRVEGETFQKPKELVLTVMTEEFPFAKVQGWYRANLGTPFEFLNNNNEVEKVDSQNGMVLPVNGVISQSFQQNGEGVLIEVSSPENMNVTAMKAGTIVFAGNKKNLGKTIIIQHEDGTNSIYGNLSDIEVFQYQFVSKNQIIGNLKPNSGEVEASLYFAVQEKKKYIDPVKVMRVDEQT
ncbi:stage IV sporulation protein FA [Salirhabdus euzebyi]|uniref:Stage IV sporulation protein FA n=1 Tax=Salirhabdus euzebyi TaxID=394506 RepID=A0A841PX11_9BACI|nr:M23 family metallopeptidase [Salirhabdus euzebyi]MBB6451916.1 stage IV sporulation protein FA [Salirhabdus euzebyi]